MSRLHVRGRILPALFALSLGFTHELSAQAPRAASIDWSVSTPDQQGAYENDLPRFEHSKFLVFPRLIPREGLAIHRDVHAMGK